VGWIRGSFWDDLEDEYENGLGDVPEDAPQEISKDKFDSRPEDDLKDALKDPFVDGYENEIPDNLEDDKIPGTGLSPTVTNQTTLTPASEEQVELAQALIKSAFPNGSIILNTSASRFECALYAVQTSMQHQVPSLVTPPIAELRAIATTGPVAQRFRDVEARKVDVNNFNAVHVAATYSSCQFARVSLHPSI
jgi:hypothetical protein